MTRLDIRLQLHRFRRHVPKLRLTLYVFSGLTFLMFGDSPRFQEWIRIAISTLHAI